MCQFLTLFVYIEHRYYSSHAKYFPPAPQYRLASIETIHKFVFFLIRRDGRDCEIGWFTLLIREGGEIKI